MIKNIGFIVDVINARSILTLYLYSFYIKLPSSLKTVRLYCFSISLFQIMTSKYSPLPQIPPKDTPDSFDQPNTTKLMWKRWEWVRNGLEAIWNIRVVDIRLTCWKKRWNHSKKRKQLFYSRTGLATIRVWKSERFFYSEFLFLFACSYDVIYTAALDKIVKKFKATGANVLFGAEPYCWPDETVDHLYPSVGYTQSKFLNSGMFIGKNKLLSVNSQS